MLKLTRYIRKLIYSDIYRLLNLDISTFLLNFLDFSFFQRGKRRKTIKLKSFFSSIITIFLFLLFIPFPSTPPPSAPLLFLYSFLSSMRLHSFYQTVLPTLTHHLGISFRLAGSLWQAWRSSCGSFVSHYCPIRAFFFYSTKICVVLSILSAYLHFRDYSSCLPNNLR